MICFDFKIIIQNLDSALLFFKSLLRFIKYFPVPRLVFSLRNVQIYHFFDKFIYIYIYIYMYVCITGLFINLSIVTFKFLIKKIQDIKI
jgi:hypothetical protein